MLKDPRARRILEPGIVLIVKVFIATWYERSCCDHLHQTSWRKGRADSGTRTGVVHESVWGNCREQWREHLRSDEEVCLAGSSSTGQAELRSYFTLASNRRSQDIHILRMSYQYPQDGLVCRQSYGQEFALTPFLSAAFSLPQVLPTCNTLFWPRSSIHTPCWNSPLLLCRPCCAALHTLNRKRII